MVGWGFGGEFWGWGMGGGMARGAEGMGGFGCELLREKVVGLLGPNVLVLMVAVCGVGWVWDLVDWSGLEMTENQWV